MYGSQRDPSLIAGNGFNASANLTARCTGVTPDEPPSVRSRSELPEAASAGLPRTEGRMTDRAA